MEQKEGKTCKTKIAEWLKSIGADGLCCDCCGCGIDELMPCDGNSCDCIPAKKKIATEADIDYEVGDEIFVPLKSTDPTPTDELQDARFYTKEENGIIYCDDTPPSDLQKALDDIEQYCSSTKFTINADGYAKDLLDKHIHFATLALKELERMDGLRKARSKLCSYLRKRLSGVRAELDAKDERIVFLENELQKYKQIGSGWGMVELTNRIAFLEDIIKRAMEISDPKDGMCIDDAGMILKLRGILSEAKEEL